jgi:hypothetical protein
MKRALLEGDGHAIGSLWVLWMCEWIAAMF